MKHRVLPKILQIRHLKLLFDKYNPKADAAEVDFDEIDYTACYEDNLSDIVQAYPQFRWCDIAEEAKADMDKYESLESRYREPEEDTAELLSTLDPDDFPELPDIYKTYLIKCPKCQENKMLLRTMKCLNCGDVTSYFTLTKQETQNPMFQMELPNNKDSNKEISVSAELQKVLDASNQLEALMPHLYNMVAGEPISKKAVVVLLVSGFYTNAEDKQIILFRGSAGGGKSNMMNTLTRGYKVKQVGRLSARALDYTELSQFQILCLTELGKMDEEKQDVSSIKFLSSEDGGYTTEVTARDPVTKKFTTELHKVPALTLVSGTTRVALDPQFDRRAWSISIDETEAQTLLIVDWMAKKEQQETEKKLGLRKATDEEISMEVYRLFVGMFKPIDVIIPFTKTLLSVLPTKELRVRGDFKKLLTFVKHYAAFNANYERMLRLHA
jgi:hypothetical protein